MLAISKLGTETQNVPRSFFIGITDALITPTLGISNTELNTESHLLMINFTKRNFFGHSYNILKSAAYIFFIILQMATVRVVREFSLRPLPLCKKIQDYWPTSQRHIGIAPGSKMWVQQNLQWQVCLIEIHHTFQACLEYICNWMIPYGSSSNKNGI